jgi:hypothetical protein
LLDAGAGKCMIYIEPIPRQQLAVGGKRVEDGRWPLAISRQKPTDYRWRRFPKRSNTSKCMGIRLGNCAKQTQFPRFWAKNEGVVKKQSQSKANFAPLYVREDIPATMRRAEPCRGRPLRLPAPLRAMVHWAFAPNKANLPRFWPANGGRAEKQSQSKPISPGRGRRRERRGQETTDVLRMAPSDNILWTFMGNSFR